MVHLHSSFGAMKPSMCASIAYSSNFKQEPTQLTAKSANSLTKLTVASTTFLILNKKPSLKTQLKRSTLLVKNNLRWTKNKLCLLLANANLLNSSRSIVQTTKMFFTVSIALPKKSKVSLGTCLTSIRIRVLLKMTATNFCLLHCWSLFFQKKIFAWSLLIIVSRIWASTFRPRNGLTTSLHSTDHLCSIGTSSPKD